MTSIPTRKIEMKTAIELAASLSARYLDTKQMLPDELAHEAAAMILHQAEQIEQLEVERLRLAGEVSNRNIRALEGDKSAAAFNTLYDEFETLRAALTASYTSELDELAVRNYSLHKENESLLKANLDCFDNFNTLMADYDALKADAERYRWMRTNSKSWSWTPSQYNIDIVSGFAAGGTGYLGHSFEDAINIASMKGKS